MTVAGWGRLRPSRALALALGALALAVVYYLALVGAAALLKSQGLASGLTLFLMPVASAVAAAIVLPSPHVRGWIKVMLAKHVFAHRYDYRAEWLRFTETLGRPGDAPAPLDVRVVKAVADIIDSPSGLLLLPGEEGVAPEAAWNREPQAFAPSAALAALLSTGRIVELDAVRRADDAEAAAIPEWIMSDPRAWAIVPLIHLERLAGAVLLDRPVVARTLDWEDFDLLRVAGRGVASYLAEAQGQEALSEAARFDEFNRRFAFIMHDIKNLVSQLTLVTRNAERHADKPEFRADMIATLQASTARMNDLLARLSQHNRARPDAPRGLVLGPLVERVAAAKRASHPVVVSGAAGLAAVADPVRLEAALLHLVQNAIEASPANEPVTIDIAAHGRETAVRVIDRGAGMSADFVRGQLFRPFASTKDGGFGIGAYEARALVAGMGGRIEVESTPGEGSVFMLFFPAATSLAEAA